MRLFPPSNGAQVEWPSAELSLDPVDLGANQLSVTTSALGTSIQISVAPMRRDSCAFGVWFDDTAVVDLSR